MKFKIDNLQYCNWNRDVFKINREAGLDAVHATIVYHEDFNELGEQIKKWQRLFTENSPEKKSKWRLAALLHDAPEYVIGDMISPFKAVIGDEYRSVEQRLQEAIHLRVGLPSVLPNSITKIIKKCNVTIIGACEQSGQNFKPSLEVFENLQSAIASEKNLIFFDLDASQKVPHTITSPVSFVTGPESDFSPKEIEHLKSISNKSYTLGGNTLRAETAAIVALSILQVNLDTL